MRWPARSESVPRVHVTSAVGMSHHLDADAGRDGRRPVGHATTNEWVRIGEGRVARARRPIVKVPIHDDVAVAPTTPDLRAAVVRRAIDVIAPDIDGLERVLGLAESGGGGIVQPVHAGPRPRLIQTPIAGLPGLVAVPLLGAVAEPGPHRAVADLIASVEVL